MKLRDLAMCDAAAAAAAAEVAEVAEVDGAGAGVVIEGEGGGAGRVVTTHRLARSDVRRVQ